MPHPIRVISVLLLSTLFTAALTAQTSVWTVTHGKNTVYLGGTCHILRPQDFPLPAEFDQAFAASTSLVFETDLEQMTKPETQQLLLGRGMFNDGKTLEKALDAKTWSTVLAYCTKSGLPAANIQNFRPWLFTVMVAVVELQKLGVTQEGVDLHYFKLGGTKGKAMHGLEGFEQHIDYLANMGAGHENEMVLSTIEDLARLPTMIGGLLDAWKTGDLAKVDEYMIKEMRDKYPAIYDQLIVKRNQAWLPRIEELLKSPETEFVLVGVGHMGGENGLLAELKKRGYQVRQMSAKD